MEFVRATCLGCLVDLVYEYPGQNFHQAAEEFAPSAVKAVLPTAALLKADRETAFLAIPQEGRQATAPFLRQSVATRSGQALSLIEMHHCRSADPVGSVKAQRFCYRWTNDRSATAGPADFEKTLLAGWTAVFEDSAWPAADV